MTQSAASPIAGIALLCLALGPGSLSAPTAHGQDGTLRQAALALGFRIGSAVTVVSCYWDGPACNPMDEPQYTRTIAREFNFLIPEGEQMWQHIHPQVDRFDFSKPDRIVDFARRNGMEVHGHALVAHNMQPPWLKAKKWTRDELEKIVKSHVFKVASHYRGRVQAWNVTNEALVCNTDIRPEVVEPPCRPGVGVVPRVWTVSRVLGPGYIDKVFRWAHEADPDALLFYSDYGIEGFSEGDYRKAKEDGTYQHVKGMVERKVPVHGIGFQMHLSVAGKYSEYDPTPEAVAANMRRYKELGLQVRITEMDVAIHGPVTQEKLDLQAEKFSDMLEVCLRAGNCTGFATWGYTDKHSWINEVGKPDAGSALLLDSKYGKKPAYEAILRVLKHTR